MPFTRISARPAQHHRAGDRGDACVRLEFERDRIDVRGRLFVLLGDRMPRCAAICMAFTNVRLMRQRSGSKRPTSPELRIRCVLPSPIAPE